MTDLEYAGLRVGVFYTTFSCLVLYASWVCCYCVGKAIVGCGLESRIALLHVPYECNLCICDEVFEFLIHRICRHALLPNLEDLEKLMSGKPAVTDNGREF